MTKLWPIINRFCMLAVVARKAKGLQVVNRIRSALGDWQYMIDRQLSRLSAAQADMTILRTQIIPFIQCVCSAIPALVSAAVSLQHRHHWSCVWSFAPLVSVFSNAIRKAYTVHCAAGQLCGNIGRIVVVTIIAVLAIARQMMIAVLVIGRIAITEIGTSACLTLITVSVKIAFVGMKISQRFRFAAFVAALEVWYSGHIGLQFRSVMSPAVCSSVGASCCVNYSIGMR